MSPSTLLPGMVVSEIFGPTVSGEGRTLGQRCGFLRLMGCNLHCSWCDTAYTWDASRYDLRKQGRWMSWAAIADALIAMDVDFVIISGGEPLLHQNLDAWPLILRTLSGAGIRVEVETNGTQEPTPTTVEYTHRITCSPKLGHAGDPEDKRIIPGVLYTLIMAGADFKFVCATPDHVAEVERIVKRTGIPTDRVWIMPLGTGPGEINRHLAMITDTAVAAGFNVTTRLHITVWGNTRGH